MRTISFNKHAPLCYVCKVNRVKRWDKPCDDCRTKKKKTELDLGIGGRLPAAIWTNEHGHKIAVDKFGKPVDSEVIDYRKKTKDLEII